MQDEPRIGETMARARALIQLAREEAPEHRAEAVDCARQLLSEARTQVALALATRGPSAESTIRIVEAAILHMEAELEGLAHAARDTVPVGSGVRGSEG